MRTMLKNFFNGIAFGVTEIVPGVSGGTVAVVLGFYDELIGAINHFWKQPRKYGKFVAALLPGMVVGFVAFGTLIHYLLRDYSFPTMLFFVGLIVGIMPIIYLAVTEPGRRVSLRRGQIALVLAPALALAAISIVSSAGGEPAADSAEVISTITAPYMFYIFLSGIVAAGALLIPGISGSFILLIMGVYPLATHALSNIRVWLGNLSDTAVLLDILKVLGPLALGIVVGGLTMARLIERYMKKHYKTVYSIMLGLLLGSIFALFNSPIVYQSGLSLPAGLAGIGTFAAGCAVSYLLGKKKL